MMCVCKEVVLIFLGVMAAIVYMEPTADIWTKLKRGNDEQVDKDYLMSQYVLLCGGSICNKNKIPLPYRTETLPNISSKYGECSCNCGSACFKGGHCCPDLAVGYIKHSCINTKVYPNDGNNDTLFNFNMVSHCPETILKVEESMHCTSPLNFENVGEIKNIPVTSQVTHITYKNQFCASCFGEETYVHWDLQVQCQDVDLNQMSSIDEIWTVIDEYNCSLVYAPGRDIELYVGQCNAERPSRPENEISTCNITGLWNNYNPDIDWACGHLDLPYKSHKNIFCYICNPSIASVTNSVKLDGCNVTGDWSETDLDLQMACEVFPAQDRLKPYKNIFCYTCNTNKWSKVNRSKFNKGVDFNVDVDCFNILSLYNYTVTAFNIQNVLNKYLRTQEPVWFDNATRSPLGNRNKGLKYALAKYVELCGSHMICKTDLLHKENIEPYNMSIPVCGVCSCDPDCVYSKSCCVDTLLTKEQFQCVSEWHLSSGFVKWDSSISVNAVASCILSESPDWMEALCKSEDTNDIFSHFPVTYCNLKYYKNAYCASCNGATDFDLVKIKISCKTNLEPDHFLTLTALVKAANKYGCLIRFQIQPDKSCLSIENQLFIKKRSISRCNVTGSWTKYDDAIASYCEQNVGLVSNLPEVSFEGLHFRNIFCFICNPGPSRETQQLISQCNVTGEWNVFDIQAEQACEQYALHSRWFPYKNWFCLQCNTDQKFLPVVPSINNTLWKCLYRPSDNGLGDMNPLTEAAVSIKLSIFSIKPGQQALFKRRSAVMKKCDNGTLDLASQTCRAMFCSRGRVLQNKTCRLLIEETEDLRYELSVGFFPVVENSASVNITVSYLLEVLPYVFVNSIYETIENHSTMEPATYCAFVSKSCNDSILIGMDYETAVQFETVVPLLTLALKIIVMKTYNRSQLEDTLVGSMYWSYNLTYMNETIVFQAKPYRHVGMQFSVANVAEGCYEQANVIDELNTNLSGTFIRVSKLMVCPLVQLTHTEFSPENTTGKILMSHSDIALGTDEFLETDNGDVRICERDYNRHTYVRSKLLPETYETSTLAFVHGLFSYFSSTLSMFCLFLSFLTYSLFRALRTLPGKNNMCLVFCLFSAQATLQFGILANDKIVCIAMGVSIHFFWLTTFCAMSACSYHMYRVFCENGLQVCGSEEEQKMFLKSLAYVTGVPCLIVALTVSVNLGISNGDNWGYGQFLCFLSSMHAVIGAFIVPASVVFSSNIYFFMKVFQTIRNTPSLQCNQKEKRDVIIYLKLCTIIGLFWPLQIVDGIIGTTVLSFLVSALNDFQGVFIFISFICNKRVVALYKHLFCQARLSLQPSIRSETIPNTNSSSTGSPQHTVQSAL